MYRLGLCDKVLAVESTFWHSATLPSLPGTMLGGLVLGMILIRDCTNQFYALVLFGGNSVHIEYENLTLINLMRAIH